MLGGIGQGNGSGTNLPLTSLVTLSQIDNGLAAGLKTSFLVKELSDTNITLLTKDNQIDSLSLNLIALVVLVKVDLKLVA